MELKKMKKTKNKQTPHIGQIRSLKDLQEEKRRLLKELHETEDGIKNNYHHLLDTLTFRNVVNTLINDVAVTSSVFSKVFTFGKKVAEKIKKKKRNKRKKQHTDPVETTPAEVSMNEE